MKSSKGINFNTGVTINYSENKIEIMKKPLLSICLRTYNNQEFILETKINALFCSMQKNDGFTPKLDFSSYLRIIFRNAIMMNDIQCQHKFLAM